MLYTTAYTLLLYGVVGGLDDNFLLYVSDVAELLMTQVVV